MKTPKTGVAKTVKHYNDEYFPALAPASELYSSYKYAPDIGYGLSKEQWTSVAAAPRSDETRDLQTKLDKLKNPMEEKDHESIQIIEPNFVSVWSSGDFSTRMDLW